MLSESYFYNSGEVFCTDLKLEMQGERGYLLCILLELVMLLALDVTRTFPCTRDVTCIL